MIDQMVRFENVALLGCLLAIVMGILAALGPMYDRQPAAARDQ